MSRRKCKDFERVAAIKLCNCDIQCGLDLANRVNAELDERGLQLWSKVNFVAIVEGLCPAPSCGSETRISTDRQRACQIASVFVGFSDQRSFGVVLREGRGFT